MKAIQKKLWTVYTTSKDSRYVHQVVAKDINEALEVWRAYCIVDGPITEITLAHDAVIVEIAE